MLIPRRTKYRKQHRPHRTGFASGGTELAFGDYGIQANHSNLMAAVVPGTMMYRLPGQPAQYAAVSAGLVKVEDNDVLVLVDSAERPEEIDTNRAERAVAEAKEAMLQKKTVQEYKMAQAHLARAINRLRVKRSFRP